MTLGRARSPLFLVLGIWFLVDLLPWLDVDELVTKSVGDNGFHDFRFAVAAMNTNRSEKRFNFSKCKKN